MKDENIVEEVDRKRYEELLDTETRVDVVQTILQESECDYVDRRLIAQVLNIGLPKKEEGQF